ncbi:MAG TPA: hypothetical protein EYG18_08595 [Micavibrio sp.]|nr:hypothetical protein [Micavibrio sp.]HIL29313.1 hypothetical protein [Micavibrio sp.]
MAYYKIGNQILSEEEYDAQNLAVWRFVLFLAGAVVAGFLVNGMYSDGLPKIWRFVGVIFLGAGAGGLLALYAPYIRAIVAYLLIAVLVSSLTYGLWLIL